jgi:hypothetical protein
MAESGRFSTWPKPLDPVMPALVAGIHVFLFLG